MLPNIRNTSVKKNLILSAIGISLQAAGTLCLLAAAVGIGTEIHRQVKTTIAKEFLMSRIAE